MRIIKVTPGRFTQYPLSEAGEEYELDYQIEQLQPLEDEEDEDE